MKTHCRILLGVALISVLAAQSQADDLIEDQARVLSFQAGLTDGKGVPLSGLHTLTFNIYDDPIIPAPLPGGGPFNINVNIPVDANGVVSVLLPEGGVGLDASLFSGSALYLGLAVDGGVELTPRIQIASVPYSMRTNFVGNLELIDDAEFGDSSTSGSVDVFGSFGAPAIQVDGGSSLISVNGSAGVEHARLWGPAWGQLLLKDDSGGTSVEVTAAQTGETFGGSFILRDFAGFPKLWGGSGPSGGFLQAYDDSTVTINMNGIEAKLSSSGSLEAVDFIGGSTLAEMTKTTDGGVFRTYDNDGTEALEAGTGSFGGGGFVILRQDDASLGLQLDGFVPGQGAVIVGRTPSPAANKSYEFLGSDGDGAGRFTMYDGQGGAGGPGAERVRIDANGDHGGGDMRLWSTSNVQTMLFDASDTEGAGLVAVSNDTGTFTIGIHGDGGNDQGFIRLRNALNQDAIILNAQDASGKGRVITDVLEIKGGADLSEQFDINAPFGVSPAAGMVVSIDPERPGKLMVSRQAYDRKVAGIISGAGGVSSGMLMGQDGSIASGRYPVALSGRVYCLVDAASAAVQPGDLLTTSNTPGHAMKVTDHANAQGAIIGKAMTRLRKGTGLVLVLVSLQ